LEGSRCLRRIKQRVHTDQRSSEISASPDELRTERGEFEQILWDKARERRKNVVKKNSPKPLGRKKTKKLKRMGFERDKVQGGTSDLSKGIAP